MEASQPVAVKDKKPERDPGEMVSISDILAESPTSVHTLQPQDANFDSDEESDDASAEVTYDEEEENIEPETSRVGRRPSLYDSMSMEPTNDVDFQTACILAVRTCALRASDIASDTVNISPQECAVSRLYRISRKGLNKKIDVKDYAPGVFSKLRTFFGVELVKYVSSWSTITGDFAQSKGKSHSKFLYSGDGRFVLKTISRSECRFLRAILEEYYNHLIDNRESLIMKIFGCVRIKTQGKDLYFIVCENILSGAKLQEVYDLKGSRQGRYVKNSEKGDDGEDGKEKPNGKEKSNGKDKANGKETSNGVKTDSPVVMKDQEYVNNQKSLWVSNKTRARLLAQLAKDIQLLEALNIMDWSLLLGISKFSSSEELRSKMYTSSPTGSPRKQSPVASPGTARRRNGIPDNKSEGSADSQNSGADSPNTPKQEPLERSASVSSRSKQRLTKGVRSRSDLTPSPTLDRNTGHVDSPGTLRRASLSDKAVKGVLKTSTSSSSPTTDNKLRKVPSCVYFLEDSKEATARSSPSRSGISRSKSSISFRRSTSDLKLNLKFKDESLNCIFSSFLKDGSQEVYFLGLIDILQPYNGKKKMANLFKSIRHNAEDLSTVNPKIYASRFLNFFPKTVLSPKESALTTPRASESADTTPTLSPRTSEMSDLKI